MYDGGEWGNKKDDGKKENRGWNIANYRCAA